MIARIPISSNLASATSKLRSWYEHCDHVAAREAILILRKELKKDGNDPNLNALLGTALLHGPELQMEGARGILTRPVFKYSNSEKEGARLLASAASAGVHEAARELFDVAIATRAKESIKLATDALANEALNNNSAVAASMLAEIAIRDRRLADARKWSQFAVQRGDSGALHSEGVAEILEDADPVAGAKHYIAGLNSLSAVQLYFDDLSYLLQPKDSAVWDELPANARGDWIRKQWDWRASIAGVSLPERLKTHFTRLVHAWDFYPRRSYRGAPMLIAVVFDESLRRMDLDDRGLIYVRHGEPDRVIHMSPGIGSPDRAREAWAYSRLVDGQAVYEFTNQEKGQGSNPDYFLALSLPCPGNSPNRPAPTGVMNYGSSSGGSIFMEYETSLALFDPSIGAYALHCMSGDTYAWGAQKLADMRKGLAALRTESAAPSIKKPLKIVIATYAMRGATGTDLFAFAAIPGESLHPAAKTNQYALRMHLSVEDASTLNATSADTSLGFTTNGLMTKGQVVRASIATHAKPLSDATVRFTLRNPNDPDQGQVITAARAIPNLSGFSISDIVVAEPRDGSWKRGNVGLTPIPGHTVAVDEPFRIFYEVYGAAQGDPLQVQITIAPGTGKSMLSNLKALMSRKAAKQVSFMEPASPDGSGTSRMLKDIAGDLDSGRYVLNVTVTNGSTGRVTSAETDLIVIGR